MGVWGKAERWSYHRKGQERRDRLSSEDSLSLTERYYCVCLGDSESGYLLSQGGGTTPVERPPHPGKTLPPLGCRQLLPLAGGVGRRVPVTTSPRLELELSPDLLCGWRSKGTDEQRWAWAGDFDASFGTCRVVIQPPYPPPLKAMGRSMPRRSRISSEVSPPCWPHQGEPVSSPSPWQTPGAEAVLTQRLFLQQAKAVQFDRAGDETNLAAFLHQPPDPPVIIVFL